MVVLIEIDFFVLGIQIETMRLARQQSHLETVILPPILTFSIPVIFIIIVWNRNYFHSIHLFNYLRSTFIIYVDNSQLYTFTCFKHDFKLRNLIWISL